MIDLPLYVREVEEKGEMSSLPVVVTKKPQLSSCFLLDVDSDSIHGIYKTLSDCAAISQSAGGIGLNIHKIRSKGSYIKGMRWMSWCQEVIS